MSPKIAIIKLSAGLLFKILRTDHLNLYESLHDLVGKFDIHRRSKLTQIRLVPDKGTQSFKCQAIAYPQGASEKDIALITRIPQYVYRLPLNLFM